MKITQPYRWSHYPRVWGIDTTPGLITPKPIRIRTRIKKMLYYYKNHTYSAFFLTVAIGNCMVKLIPPVNFCSDENIQTIFGTKLKDFLNYRIDYNSIS
jgi:hypothetical protein